MSKSSKALQGFSGFLWAVFVVAVFIGLLALSGCGPQSTPVLGPDGQPTGQSVNSGPGVGTGAILGGIAGYMLGRSASSGGGGYGGGYHSPTVVNRTVVNKSTTIIKQAPPQTVTKPSVPSYTRPSTPSYSRPSVPSYSRPSTGGGFRSGRR